MPLLGLLGTLVGWIVSRFSPWMLLLLAAIFTVATDWARDFVFQLAIIALSLFDFMFTELFGKGELNLSDRLAEVPVEMTYFLGLLRILEAAGIVISGLACRIIRKIVLRW